MLTNGFPALWAERGYDGTRAIVFPLGGARGGGIPGRVSCRLRVCDGKGSGKQPLRGAGKSLATAFPLLGGRERSDRVGINQPQADRLMALSSAPAGRSFHLIPLASGPAEPGRGTTVSL